MPGCKKVVLLGQTGEAAILPRTNKLMSKVKSFFPSNPSDATEVGTESPAHALKLLSCLTVLNNIK